ncbi:MAG: hypothetical protein HY653_00480 [Acidobacteria bacterium]|nr:hypothetical protein [Acidobacteriota bacterium]
MSEIYLRVECYAGRQADERPQRFQLHAHTFEVEEVLDQWYSPDATYFRVRAHDGNFYILRHAEPQDAWTLVSFRRQEASRD